MAKIHLHVLITEDQGVYNAICLEMSLAAAGPGLQQVKQDMAELIKSHITACEEENRPEDMFVPAPAEDWAALRQAIMGNTCTDEETFLPPLRLPAAQELASHLDIHNLFCGAVHAARA